jgi:DNA repair exonuclease SbcCD ATPase subunit
MKFASRIVALVAIALAVAPTVAGRVQAADAQAVTAEIEAHNKAFLSAYENGQVGKMKSEVKKAIALGEKNGLASDPANPIMADTYVLAAILEVDVNENTAAGVKDFQKALKIKPDVAIPKGMATSPVKLALKQAKEASGEAPKEATAAAPAEKDSSKAEPAKTGADEEKAEKTDKAADKAEKARAEAEAKEREKQEKAEREEQARQEKADKAERQKAEAAQAKDKAAQEKQLADAKARGQQLEKDKADASKQLADAKARIAQLEKDKAAQDKQLADANKQLADAKARIAQLEKDKGDKDKQLADARARIAQLEKDKGDKDKALADARAREAKEREGREKIEKEHQAAEAAAREADAKKKAEQENRQRLFAGPAMPPTISEQVHCEVPDEAPLRTDLFVHCVAKPSLKARTIVFYYRAGSAHYYSVPMERTAKGWYAAIVPGVRVIGRSMQYYAEALNEREAVVGRNGKESSPNILTLKPSAPRG